jgi:hypothetical protein
MVLAAATAVAVSDFWTVSVDVAAGSTDFLEQLHQTAAATGTRRSVLKFTGLCLRLKKGFV